MTTLLSRSLEWNTRKGQLEVTHVHTIIRPDPADARDPLWRVNRRWTIALSWLALAFVFVALEQFFEMVLAQIG